ncbi:MAG: MFS transporter [Gammaproteobacteria bacterium]|nr:MFS transporter [Gammaproteobacteria bacterium]
MTKVTNFSDALLQLRDSRYLTILLFGFCSGFPWVLHGSILTIWLQDSGLSRSSIGVFGVVATVYAFNWLWAPMIDRLKIPLLGRFLGQRRSWIVFCQCIIALLVWAISLTDPVGNLFALALFALGIAVSSATLDVAVDAYRIKVFQPHEMDAKLPYAAAMSTSGWFAGFGFLGGAIALALGGETIGFSWPQVYQIIGCFYVLLNLLICVIPRPEAEEREEREEREEQEGLAGVQPSKGWLLMKVLVPYKEFFDRCGLKLASSVLLFLLFFRLGEAMLGRMSIVFYGEIGFSVDQISFYQKFYGGLLTAGFSLVGAMVNTRFGVIKGLFVAGIAMASANLLFAVLAAVGPNTQLFAFALGVDNFFQAFATVAFVSFISYFTSRTYTGTQYALMSSVSNFGRTTLAAGSGFVVDYLNGDWTIFFVITTLLVIPGLVLLLRVGRLISAERNDGKAYLDR